MHSLFYRNRQLLALTLTLIIVWGLAAVFTLPRMEDPAITQRVATVVTPFPGASPERVESLVTEPIEQILFELDEIESLRSTSSRGLSIVTVELKEAIRQVEPVWAKVRSKLQDVQPQLPPDAATPDYRDGSTAASALIVGLTWELNAPPNFTILYRTAKALEDRIRAIPGTDTVELFGNPSEEIRVEVSPLDLATLGLTPQALAQQIQASDAKLSAGQLRSNQSQVLIEVSSAIDSLMRVRQIPIRVGGSGQVAQLGDIATVVKGVQEPLAELAIVNGYPAVVLAAQVESQARVDAWARQARQVLNEARGTLSDGLGLRIVLDQSQYVEQRLNGVMGNLVTSSLLVVGVSLLLLGWRAALIVGSALPLATLMVFGIMQSLGVPLHQMSVTGLIIALGLLIDNAIVVVDEVQHRLRAGIAPAQAVADTGRHLTVPLLASTLTTVLAFVPIASSPGSVGEFIGTIGLTVILALVSSLLLSLTVIPALAARLLQGHTMGDRPRWWQHGLQMPAVSRVYHWSLGAIFRRPWLGVGLALVLPLVGFTQFGTLEQQFFPPTNRDQAQVELLLSPQTAIAQTQHYAQQIRDLLLQHPAVAEVHWFLGSSAPPFFYNVAGQRDDAANYAQGIVQLQTPDRLRDTLRTLQTQVDAAFPEAQVLVKQLEQGPPFDAPIELRLYGQDLMQMQALGNDLRLRLAQLPEVTHTRASLADALPKLALTVDEVQARRAGLENSAIARQLDAALDGAVGGSLLEATEDIPVRVRLADTARGSLAQVASLDVLSAAGQRVPLGAIAEVDWVPSLSTLQRRNGQRINTVQAYLEAGALPDTVLAHFRQQLSDSGWALPPGVRLEYGGEADARGTAVGNLLSTVGVLLILMTATLVLSFNSFGLAALIATVAIASVGLAALALWVFNSVFGFTAILGTLGLIGLAINDSIVVLAALQTDPNARVGDRHATQQVVFQSTRHVIATTLTTIVGFVPLLLDSTGFWPPMAIAIAGGLGGATLLALYYIPAAHLLLARRATAPLISADTTKPRIAARFR
ncbi:MAG: efflux RND transporter permease subunit [Kaiparowitsia implicata GSE-PSE-MK54-09C]|jgi:multidrug efflux pump subunit AcrB|nr:efflux RND transporter permease subunit [Kaiparowitsia implicata GSE-PSE-MK54-09C]